MMDGRGLLPGYMCVIDSGIESKGWCQTADEFLCFEQTRIVSTESTPGTQRCLGRAQPPT